MTTGERIRKWREWAGLRRADVAGALGITPAAISYWETGKTTPRPSNLEGFAGLVGISLESFYGPVPRRHPTSEPRT